MSDPSALPCEHLVEGVLQWLLSRGDEAARGAAQDDRPAAAPPAVSAAGE